MTPFNAPGKQAFWKHWEKEELFVTSNFSFTHSVFYPFKELSAIFIKFKMSSLDCFNLDQSKICCLVMG